MADYCIETDFWPVHVEVTCNGETAKYAVERTCKERRRWRALKRSRRNTGVE